MATVASCFEILKGHSMSNGPKFHRLRHDPSQILMKLLQSRGIYEVKLSSKSQHKLITSSKDMTPQSRHGKLNIDKTIKIHNSAL